MQNTEATLELGPEAFFVASRVESKVVYHLLPAVRWYVTCCRLSAK